MYLVYLIWNNLDLHPLLVSEVRDKRTAISILDTSLLPDRPDRANGFFCRDWALEMRRIGRKLAYKSHQSLRLLWSDCEFALVNVPGITILKTAGIRTARIVAHLHNSRADSHEQNAVLLILHVELGDNDVHGCLGGSV